MNFLLAPDNQLVLTLKVDGESPEENRESCERLQFAVFLRPGPRSHDGAVLGSDGVMNSELPSEVSLPDAPISREQWRAFWAVFLGWVVDAFDFNILAFVLIDIQRTFSVDRALAGLLGTVTLVVRIVGAVAAGTLAD